MMFILKTFFYLDAKTNKIDTNIELFEEIFYDLGNRKVKIIFLIPWKCIRANKFK